MSRLDLKEGDQARIRARSTDQVPAYRCPWIYGKVNGFARDEMGEEHPIIRIAFGYYFAHTGRERVEKVTHMFSEN